MKSIDVRAKKSGPSLMAAVFLLFERFDGATGEAATAGARAALRRYDRQHAANVARLRALGVLPA